MAAQEGVVVGAATVRSYEGRVIEYRSSYTVNWLIGAGMVLFSRVAARLILDQYENLLTTARELRRFYAETLGVDLGGAWQLFFGRIDRRLFGGEVYDMLLLKEGMASVGSIPSLADDLEFDVWNDYQDKYVTLDKSNAGLAHPLITQNSLHKIYLTDPTFSLVWLMLKRMPHLLPFVKFTFLPSNVTVKRNYVPNIESLPERLRQAKLASGRRKSTELILLHVVVQ